MIASKRSAVVVGSVEKSEKVSGVLCLRLILNTAHKSRDTAHVSRK